MSTTLETTALSSTLGQSQASADGLAPALAQRQVEAVIRAHSKTFSFATALLPASARSAVRALYAFCRVTDDLVDLADEGSIGIAEVENWRAEVAQPAMAQTNPLLYTWARVRDLYGVERRYENELIDGVEMDIAFKPYPTWADLERYCYRVAATVGLLSIPIIGLAKGVRFESAARYATQLGVALQLTNILRDVGEDARRGRVYFPLEDLQRFGLTLDDILQGVCDERFVGLMRFEIQRTRELYRAALPGIRLLSPSARPSVGAAALLYRQILAEIERSQYRVHQQRTHTSGLQKLLMLPGILWTIWTL